MEAVIGNAFTFSVLFVDALNNPIEVDDPLITVFSYSQAGVKQILVNAQPLIESVPAETGRYTYTYTVPSSFSDGDAFVGIMQGTDPASEITARVEQGVVAISAARGQVGGGSGMTARFF
jgi:hypothetical protein